MNIRSENDFKVKKLTDWGIKKYTLDEHRVDVKIANIWIEAKKSYEDTYDMLAQIIFTAYKVKEHQLLPLYFACFNANKGAIIENYQAQDVFLHSDIDWIQAPSGLDQKTIDRIKFLIKDVREFNNLDDFGKEIARLEKNPDSIKSSIDKNNFLQIYQEWLDAFGNQINIVAFQNKDIILADCYLADLMTDGVKTIAQKLRVLLDGNLSGEYFYKGKINELFAEIKIPDQQKYKNFWSKYNRPPKDEYQEYILQRRDLLIPANIRETKGAYFTPEIWCKVSAENLAEVFGENWQDEYYIWDPACGTGNLGRYLVNQRRVFMSTLDESDINVMDQIPIMPNTTKFQFDFVNDLWLPIEKGGKIPNSLWRVIKEESYKLIIYMNPPYVEATSYKKKSKTGSTQSSIKERMKESLLGKESNELFAQFYFRIYNEIKNCKIASFSKLKNCSGPNFENFRTVFKAKFCGGFLCEANTFDNVVGSFPISFQIWDTETQDDFPKKLAFKVYDPNGKRLQQKIVKNYKNTELINSWFKTTHSDKKTLGYIRHLPGDFQGQRGVYISSKTITRPIKLTELNIFQALIYLAVRIAPKKTWLNDRDQFKKPKVQKNGVYDYETDEKFINNCVVYSLFTKNYTNWQLFLNSDIGLVNNDRDLEVHDILLEGKQFSPQAQDVLNVAKQIYTIYHQNFINPNASWDEIIKELKKSKEQTCLDLFYNLKITLQILELDIMSDSIKYGFLDG